MDRIGGLEGGRFRETVHFFFFVPDHLLEFVVRRNREGVVLHKRFDIVVNFLLAFQLAGDLAFHLWVQTHLTHIYSALLSGHWRLRSRIVR